MQKINSLQDFTNRLEKVKPLGGGEYQARCPSHEDDNPSLSVTESNGKILLYCHAGCSTREILDALGLDDKDLFLKQNGSSPTRGDIVETYDYRDEDGNLLYQVCRTEDKAFPQRRPVADGWEWGLGKTDRVLYKLPKVKKAIEEGRYVFLVEGEKDVNNMEKLGFVATCNPMGAGKWDKSYTDTLQGANVVILPDNDEEGHKHARRVARELKGVADALKVVELPNLPDKGDVSDWINSGGSADELKTLVKEEKEFSAKVAQSNEGGEEKEHKGGRKAQYVELTEDITVKDLAGPPKFPKEILGNDALGKYTKWTGENTETPTSFAFASFKNQLGLAIGRNAKIYYGQSYHSPVFYDALIGKSAFSRKSTAINSAYRIISKATSTRDEPDPFITIPGIGSAEGVLERIQGTEGEVIGRYPKALIKLDELSVLTDRMTQKTTQSLISRFIELWDLPNKVTNPTRNEPIELERPTVSFLAGSTVENVKGSFDDRTIMGGFYNRFCWWASRESKRVPRPKGMDEELKNELTKDTKEIIQLARDMKDNKFKFSQKSGKLFDKWYKEFRDRVEKSDRGGVPVARTPELVIRHALLFSLLEGENEISKKSLLKAIQVGDYLRKSAYHVLERFSETDTDKLKRRVVKVLKEKGPIKKSKLSEATGPYRDDISELNQLLRDMEELGLIHVEER